MQEPEGAADRAIDLGEEDELLVTREPLNVRTGPGNEYPSLGKVPIGSILGVVGVSPDREYYVVNVPLEIDRSGRGWVPARYVKTENVSNVPVVQPPPVP